MAGKSGEQTVMRPLPVNCGISNILIMTPVTFHRKFPSVAEVTTCVCVSEFVCFRVSSPNRDDVISNCALILKLRQSESKAENSISISMI